jgi:hypothetical protein
MNTDFVPKKLRKSGVNIMARNKSNDRKYATNFRTNNWFGYRRARINQRSKAKGFEYCLTSKELEALWVDNCPICGVKLDRMTETQSPNSASVDRFDNDIGYVKENVCFVCWRCNNIKKDSSIDELLMIAHGYQKLQELRNHE